MNSRTLKGLILAAVSYVLLYLVFAMSDFLPKWDAYGTALLRGHAVTGYGFVDPLFLLAPLVGFVMVWLAIDAYLHHFKDTFVLSVPFALVYVLVSYAAFFVAMIGYFWNNAYLGTLQQGSPDTLASLGQTIGFVIESFMSYLLTSPYFAFTLGGLLGWLSFVLIHSVWEESHPHIPRKHAASAPLAPSPAQ